MRKDADRARAKALFQQMSKKEKWAHILRYYWMHMVVAATVLGLAVSIGISVRDSIAREDFIYVALQEGYSGELETQVEALAQEAGWPEELNFSYFPSSEAQDVSGSIQLVLYLTADQVDFIVCDDFTKRVLLGDETLDLTVLPLEQTRLGERVDFAQDMYVIGLNDTGRQEKVQQFMPILMG